MSKGHRQMALLFFAMELAVAEADSMHICFRAPESVLQAHQPEPSTSLFSGWGVFHLPQNLPVHSQPQFRILGRQVQPSHHPAHALLG
jgi:hypothetical protein